MTVASEQYSVDILVIGSGNGGLTAALCSHLMGEQSVLIIEKGERFGGTSAMSGGGIWIPCNRYATACNNEDSLTEARTYLKASTPTHYYREEMIEAYLENGPKMLDFLHHYSAVRYQSLAHYPDYYSHLPGAKNGHRSLEPEPLKASDLGSDYAHLKESAMLVYKRFMLTQVEGQLITGGLTGRFKALGKLILRHYADLPWLIKHKSSRRLTCGVAGVARLFLSLQQRQVPMWNNTSLKSLLHEEKDGQRRVVGAIVERNGTRCHIQANKAVILAAGGFEKNQSMREQYLPEPTNRDWSAGIESNTGDAIVAGQEIGSATSQMDCAWWCSTVRVPGREYPFLSIVTKSLPGTFVVNQSGQRYGNESQNYMSWSEELFRVHSNDNDCVPSYMIFDKKFKNKYSAYPLVGPDWLLPKSFFSSGLLAKANSITELAEKTGIDAAELSKTVTRFNTFALSGKDLDFQRGDAIYDRYYGDAKVKPNPCLASVDTAPYYAMRIDAGDFGTRGGLLTNPQGQVLDEDGQEITGLYATGNCSAAILPSYPGPGSTLGPAMTFAYQAAKHISGYKEK